MFYNAILSRSSLTNDVDFEEFLSRDEAIPQQEDVVHQVEFKYGSFAMATYVHGRTDGPPAEKKLISRSLMAGHKRPFVADFSRDL